MAHYKQLEVWQKAMRLAVDVYCISSKFPKEEAYGLTSQVRRSAVSIPSNIAEGNERAGRREFLQFLAIARGSAAELETQLLLARQIGFLPKETTILGQIVSVRQMLNALMRSLKEAK